MPRPIGYYVHHQGAGHLERARLIAGALKRPCTLIGTFAKAPDAENILPLPDDRIGQGFDAKDNSAHRPNALHYAPVGHVGVRDRMATIAGWIATHDPALMIVDVSVEVAMFARLLSVPVVVVRLAGRRDDEPHLDAFRAAEALIAPFPPAFENAATPAWVKAKTIYLGFLNEAEVYRSSEPVPYEIAVVLGRGGHPMQLANLCSAARATPKWLWKVCGATTVADSASDPLNLSLLGWVEKIDHVIDRAEIIIGACGDGMLAAVVSRGKRFICIPESRPFDEQVDKAKILATLGLAIVLERWPDGLEWPSILDQAKALDPARLGTLHEPNTIAKASAAIETIASRFDR